MVRQAELELAVTDQEIREAEARTERLRERRAGLKFMIEYAREASVKSSRPTRVQITSAVIPSPGSELAQTDLCITALGTFDLRQASTTEVREKLNAAGHDLDQDKVRSALAYLLRQGRVERVRDGVWRLPGVSPALPSVPFEPSMNGAATRAAGAV